MDEKQIIRLCQNGLCEYCEPLVEKYEEALYRYCFHLCQNSQNAKDLFQETWLKAINRITTYDESYSFKNWLMAIASNGFKDHYRKKVRSNLIFKEFYDSEFKARKMASVASSELPADEIIMGIELRRQLKMEVSRLKWPFQSVVVLHYYEERSVKDISMILGIPEGTVKSRLSHSRKILREGMDHINEKYR